LHASRNAATTSVPSTGQRRASPRGQFKVLIVPDIFDPAL
jgi:hypothetical protein